MRKLAAILWLLGILALGEELDGMEVFQPTTVTQASGKLVEPVLGIRG